MSCDDPMGRIERQLRSPAAEDAVVEAALLAFLIEEQPASLTVPELSLALNPPGLGFDADDAVERAIRELVGAGLLHCRGGFVLPTRAAIYYSRLGVS